MPTDLELVRSSSPIDTTTLASYLRTRRQREIRDRILPIVVNDPIFNKSKLPFLNHSQHLVCALRVSKRLLELRDAHSWNREELMAAMELQYDSLPTILHETAFINSIESQGSEEQKAFWLPKCNSYEIVGCYAQTEIAHGSNVQGLETTARYDPASKEFVVFSPSLESSKWWIGGLGVLANHVLLQAILQTPIPGKKDEFRSHGPHLFIVPVRDLRSHEPLPGVTVGDIGPKAYGGFRTMDHGFLNLSSIRIPLSNMLMRHAKVTEAGEYKPAKHDKLSYGSMTALRSAMPVSLGWTLARAVTIAIRYTICRRQFSATPGGRETQVLEYASTKHRLYPLLAQAYAYIISGKELYALFQRMTKDLIEKGDVKLLPEVHILSTALKIKSTSDCVRGAEEARKACGGHGYSYMSGIGRIFANSVPSQTFEGDNYVISQQVSRSLLKNLAQLRSGSHQLPETSLYLERTLPPAKFGSIHSKVKSQQDWLQQSHQVEALQHRAAWLVLELAESVTNAGEKAWTAHSWTSSKIAAAHGEVYILSSFHRSISSFDGGAEMKSILQDLCNLYALYTLVSALPELFESGAVDRVQSRLLREALEAAVEKLTLPEVVGLTDAFGFADFELDSVLGKEDGKVYEEMLRRAKMTDIGKGEDKDEIRRMALAIVGHSKQKDKAKL